MNQLLVKVSGAALVVLFSGSSLSAQGFKHTKASDPMNDEDRSVVSVEVDGARLGWACQADGLNVIYVSDKFLTGAVSVQVRFPPDPASPPQEWDTLTSRKGAALPVSQVDKFTEQALRSSNIVLRATSSGEVATNQFALTGLAEALQKLPCAQPGGACQRL